jgi:hypothetical protein
MRLPPPLCCLCIIIIIPSHGKHCAVRKNKELTAKTRKKNKSPPNEGLPELRLCLPTYSCQWPAWPVGRDKTQEGGGWGTGEKKI